MSTKLTCPTCGSSKVTFSVKHNRWQCGSHHAKRQFTVKTETIFEDSPLGLDKWLIAMWMVINCKNGVSSYEIARDLGITQKSAWFILHRLREVMQDNAALKLGGPSFQGVNKDIEVWPDANGKVSWTERFVDYLKHSSMSAPEIRVVLDEIEVAMQTEVPTTKQTLSDSFWAWRGC